MLVKTLAVLLFYLSLTDSYKIIGIFPATGSQYILGSKLMIGLAEAGHNITFVSSAPVKNPPKNSSIRNIVIEGFVEYMERKLDDFNLFNKRGAFSSIKDLAVTFNDVANFTVKDPSLQQLVASGEKFDGLIIGQFYLDALKVYGYLFKCPIILLGGMGPNSLVNSVLGNPQPVSYVPHIFTQNMPQDLSIWKRTENLLNHLFDNVINYFLLHPGQESIVHTYYPEAPSLEELYNTNVSLFLLNSHVSTWRAVPMVPNMVEVGGYFIDAPKKLPDDLQKFLDGAKDGAIYFSMGSNLKSKHMPEERKRAFLNLFGNLTQKVIWKFEDDNLPGKPANVLLKKWCPQQDILAHPNIKLFITHGGLLSTTETIYHGVPILALPVFSDQPSNADKAEKDGYALSLPYHDPDFSEDKLRELVYELLTNPKYTEVAKYKSKLFHDRPMKPMETAIYWVEYAIRHKGAKHLRVAGINLPWYKYFMVDIFGLIIMAIALSTYVLKLVLGKVSGKVCPGKSARKKKVN